MSSLQRRVSKVEEAIAPVAGNLPPLIVFDGDASPEEIDAARRCGRHVIEVVFVGAPDHVTASGEGAPDEVAAETAR